MKSTEILETIKKDLGEKNITISKQEENFIKNLIKTGVYNFPDEKQLLNELYQKIKPLLKDKNDLKEEIEKFLNSKVANNLTNNIKFTKHPGNISLSYTRVINLFKDIPFFSNFDKNKEENFKKFLNSVEVKKIFKEFEQEGKKEKQIVLSTGFYMADNEKFLNYEQPYYNNKVKLPDIDIDIPDKNTLKKELNTYLEEITYNIIIDRVINELHNKKIIEKEEIEKIKAEIKDIKNKSKIIKILKRKPKQRTMIIDLEEISKLLPENSQLKTKIKEYSEKYVNEINLIGELK